MRPTNNCWITMCRPFVWWENWYCDREIWSWISSVTCVWMKLGKNGTNSPSYLPPVTTTSTLISLADIYRFPLLWETRSCRQRGKQFLILKLLNIFTFDGQKCLWIHSQVHLSRSPINYFWQSFRCCTYDKLSNVDMHSGASTCNMQNFSETGHAKNWPSLLTVHPPIDLSADTKLVANGSFS